MFKNKTINIIAIDRKRLLFVQVVDGDQPQVQQLGQKSLSNIDWVEALAEAKTKFSNKKCRVLLADDLAYLLTLKIEDQDLESRAAVKKKVQEYIPELLTDDDWDYRVVAEEKDAKKIIVFAPVKDFFLEFSQAVREVGLEVEAIEPFNIAQKRNKNPFVGLAQKQDISGPDAKVLNLIVDQKHYLPAEEKTAVAENNEPSASSRLAKNKKRREKSKLPLLLTVFGFLVVLLGVLLELKRPNSKIKQLFTGGEGELESPVVEEEIAMGNEEPTEASPSADLDEEKVATESAEINLAEIRVEVLNGSGIAGLAGKVADILQAQGFADIETGNADNYEYEKTQVQYLPDIDKQVLTEVERALNDDFELEKQDSLTEEDELDLRVIIGQN